VKILDPADLNSYRPTENVVANPLDSDLNQTINRTVANTKQRCGASGDNNNEAEPVDVETVVGVEKPEKPNVIQVNVIILQSATSRCLQEHLYGSDVTDGRPSSSNQDNSNHATSSHATSSHAPSTHVTSVQVLSSQAPSEPVALRRKKVSIQKAPTTPSYLTNLSVVREESEIERAPEPRNGSGKEVGGGVGKRPSMIRRWSQLGAFGSTVAKLSKGRKSSAKVDEEVENDDDESNKDNGCEGVPLRRESG
jgi:hypothetical protein